MCKSCGNDTCNECNIGYHIDYSIHSQSNNSGTNVNTIDWSNIINKPTLFNPIPQSHSFITDWVSAVNAANYISSLASTNSITLSNSSGVLSADFNLFSGSYSGGNLIITNTIEPTGLLSTIPYATSGDDGVLSQADYSIFMAKQDVLNGIGFVKSTYGIISYDTNTYLTGNQSITLGGILSGSGTTFITASVASGYYMPTITNVATWNAKQSALTFGTVSETGSSVLSLTGAGGAVIGSGLTIQVKQAGTGQDGYLGQTDWNLFNNKPSLTSFSSTAPGLTYTNTTGVFSLTSGYVIPTTSSATTWDTAYLNRIVSFTTIGSSGAATFVPTPSGSGNLNIPNYTLSGLGGQPLSSSLTSLSGLTYASTSFVKMTASGTFALDTNTYLTTNQSITLTGDVTGSGTTSIVTTLANSGVSAASYGSNVIVPVFAVNAKGLLTSVTATAMPTADAVTRGLLTAADWGTFNNKQNHLFNTAIVGYSSPSGTSIPSRLGINIDGITDPAALALGKLVLAIRADLITQGILSV